MYQTYIAQLFETFVQEYFQTRNKQETSAV